MSVAPVELTLDGVVAHWARQRPDHPALEFDHAEALTWQMLEHNVAGVAHALPVQLMPGDVVGLVCDDGADFHVLVNALWRRGLEVLLLNRTWGTALVADLLDHLDCVILFAPTTWTVALPERVERLAYPRLSDEDTVGPSSSGGLVRTLATLDSVAMYAPTSGTTDDPKIVPVTHRQIRSAYRTCRLVHDFAEVRRCASLFSLNGLGVLGVCFLLPREVGATTRVFPPFTMANIQRSWREILAGDVDFVYLVPPLVRLLRLLPTGPPSYLDRRLLAFCAAAPVEQEELQALEQRFPVRVFNVYGLTELTFAVFFGCREPDGQASGSIGYPVGIEARIIADEQVVEGAATGELHIRGPMLTEGYRGNPAAAARARIGGWFRTGDIAERDDHGRYFIRGRAHDSVIRGGVLTYLHEVEHYLRGAPGVVDVCAFRGRLLPSGDELCAAVQADTWVANDDLVHWMTAAVGREKVPNLIFVQREEFPRNSNGKVDRPAVAARHLGSPASPIDSSLE